MIFRTRQPDATVWKRFRSGTDGFTFTRKDGFYEAHVAANAERVVDLFYTLSEHLPPAIDVRFEDRRTERSWSGDSVALPDIRDAIARLKVALSTYGGVEISAFTGDDQLTLTPQLELFAFSRTDRWAYFLQARGLEEFGALAEKPWRTPSWDRAPAPMLSESISAAATRLSLTQA